MNMILRFDVDDQVAAVIEYDVRQDCITAIAFGVPAQPEVRASSQTIEGAVRALSVKLRALKATQAG